MGGKLGDLIEAQESFDRASRLARAVVAYSDFMDALGLDRDDPHLAGTALRVSKMYLDELLSPREFVMTVFAAESDAMISQRGIPFSSLCSHHFQPFVGVAHVAYIPNEYMVGLSKLARTVEYYSRRPQVQERLTEQIADRLTDALNPLGVAVTLEAEHYCMSLRGVHKAGVVTVTTALRGAFREQPEVRAEYVAAIRG